MIHLINQNEDGSHTVFDIPNHIYQWAESRTPVAEVGPANLVASLPEGYRKQVKAERFTASQA